MAAPAEACAAESDPASGADADLWACVGLPRRDELSLFRPAVGSVELGILLGHQATGYFKLKWF